MNPASLSENLVALFPPGAVAAELRGPGLRELLMPAEELYMGRAAPQRVQEFAAGRLCARRALAEFGIADFPIRVADDRQPIWPESMVGSITHTAGFCAAVVAPRQCAGGLGLDSEVVGDISVELWPGLCVPAELSWIRSLHTSQQPAAITLIFSAKEAFYKCQYPVARERLEFKDVSVEALTWGGSDGAFQIHATRSRALLTGKGLPVQGRYLFHRQFVTAGMGLAVAGSAQ